MDTRIIAMTGAQGDRNILSNDGALRIGAVPKKLALIGSGVIGAGQSALARHA